jgi:signal transduction histidine kinase
MFSSLRSRLWFSFALLIAVVLLVTAFSLLIFVARANLSARLELRQAAERILLLNDQPDSINPNLFEQIVNRIDQNQNFRTLIVNRSGSVAADSRMETEAEFPLIRRLPKDPRTEVIATRDADGKTWLYTGRPIGGGYVILLAVERQPLKEVAASPLSRDLLSILGQSGLIAFALALLLALVISKSIAAPLQQISNAAREVAEGKQITVRPAGPREVRQLGESFNQMSLQIHASQQSQRDFVANVSHELKTPLTSVQGFAQALIDGTAATPEAQKQAAQVIYDEAGRMHTMVLDLLDLAKLDAGTADLEYERVDLAILLDSVIERFTPQSTRAKVSLVKKYQDLPEVTGDGDRLAQVFNNLVDNALKHTPPGSTIYIAAIGAGQSVEISITDNGPGIPQEEISRIFERFYQLDKSRQGGPAHGAGLGLAIASQIVHAHGGQIKAHSEPGKGSKFTVLLPTTRPNDPTLASMPAANPRN